MVKTNKRVFRILPILLLGIAILIIGGAIAYNQSAKHFDNSFHLSAEDISHIETFDSPENWQPCSEEPKTLVTTNNSNHPIKVRISWDEYWRNKADTEDLPLEQDGRRLTTINFQNETDWEQNGDWYYWKGELAPGASTRSLFKSVTLDCNANLATNQRCVGDQCVDEPNPYTEAKYHIDIKVQTTDENFPDDTNTVTVTVNPNGGKYKNSTEPTIETVSSGGSYTIAAATREGYDFNHWEYTDGTQISGNTIQNITSNISIRATWTAAIARIERTGELYPSIMDAIANAQTGDTITLLTDLTETVTSSKNITLDLGGHTLTGSLSNGGNLTLLNGEINNPNGAAVINNGTLTMGIDDYTAEGANIDENFIRLVGTTTGIDQNGTFNFYDGYIEGETALNGGYTGTPSYQGTTYLPFADYNDSTNTQHVKLTSTANAVSKTIIGGEIYYDNLQKNINDSIRTGYKIYIVNDFEAQYDIDIPQNKTIEIDLDGHNVSLKDDVTIDGNLTLEDSETTTTYAGSLSTQNTITNNGILVLKNIEVIGTSNSDTIQNNSALTMINSELSNTSGYVMRPVSGASYTIDNDSTFRANGNVAAVYNTISGFEWTNGNISGQNISFQNAENATATIKGGTIYGGTYGIYSAANSDVTIGDNSDAISLVSPVISSDGYALYGDNSYNFYDGILHANIKVVPNNTTIKAMPNGYELHVEQNANYTENGWLVLANAYLEVDGVSYATLDDAYNAITGNSGTIKVIKTTTVDAVLPASPENKTITFDLNGHELTYTQTMINKSNMTIVDSSQAKTGKLINNNSDANASTVRNDTTLTLESGQIVGITRAILTSSGSTTNIDGGQVTASNPNGAAYGIESNGALSINNGTISAEGTSETIGIKTASNIQIENSSITVASNAVSATNNNVIGIDSSALSFNNAYIKDNTISVDGGADIAIGIKVAHTSTNIDITDNIISVTGSNDTYGLYENSASTGGTINFNGNTTTSNSTNGNGYGISSNNTAITIPTGTITSSKYGIASTTANTITIGSDDGAVSITNPEIIGTDYALYSGTFNFYDGILRGAHAYTNGVITTTPNNYSPVVESSVDYAENAWLEDANSYLEVAGTKYASLDTAYAAITGDTGTIKVIKDITIDATHPTSPTGKTITFDLNGHNLTYTKPIINASNMIVTDSSEGHVGSLTNNASNSYILSNNNAGTLTIRDAHIIANNYGAIYNSNILNIESGLIESDRATISNSSNKTVNMSGGTIRTRATLRNVSCISNSSNGKLNFSGDAKVELIHSTDTYYPVAISNLSGVITMSGNATITASSTSAGSLEAVDGGTVNMSDNAKIEVTSTKIARGVDETSNLNIAANSNVIIKATSQTNSATAVSIANTVDIKSGTIEANGKTSAVAVQLSNGTIENATLTAIGATQNNNIVGAVAGNGTLKNNTITATGSGKTIGINSSCDTASTHYTKNYSDNTITSTSTGSDAYGIAICLNSTTPYDSPTPIDGGTITATSASGVGYGIYSAGAIITSGTISGSTYGVYTIDGQKSTIGEKGGNVSDSDPMIIGKNYGLYGGNIEFYDGIIKGSVDHYKPASTFSEFEPSYTITFGSETIDSTTYKTAWLVPEHNVARVGSTGVEYTRLDNAINAAASTGDTVYLIDDNYITFDLTIPNTKEIIIDMNGYNMYAGNCIVNQGKLDFANSQVLTNQSILEAASSVCAFDNQTNATLGFEDIEVQGKQPIKNNGEVYIVNTKIEGLNTAVDNLASGTVHLGNANIISTKGSAINNAGYVMTDQNNNLNGYTYALYNSGNEATLESMSTEGTIYAYAGKIEIANSNVTTKGAGYDLLKIDSGAEMILDNTVVFSDADNDRNYNTSNDHTVNNAGTFSANDSTFTRKPRDTEQKAYIIYNTGTATIIESTITLDIGNRGSKVLPYGYGIYNQSNTTTYAGGIINFPGRTNYAYGIYANAGTVIIGKPVPDTDPNYGTQNADVSTSNPDIKAVGNYGHGVFNNNAQIKWYDGIISGKQGSFNKAPNVLEYNFEKKDYTNTTDSYPYSILEWVSP